MSHLPSLDWRLSWLATSALLAGVLNAVAGGGSFLLFPAILGMKILPIQANATNTVALWPGQFTSLVAYRKDIARNLRLVPLLAVVSLLGGTAGAVVLLVTPQTTFLHLVPWLLLVGASIFAVSGPISRWLDRRRGALGGGKPRALAVALSVAFVCFYIGYFGAGAGFLIITALSLCGFQDLHEINALKVVSTMLANGMAFVIFVYEGQVVWRICLVAMVACGVGGYASARLARRVPQAMLRGLVVVVGLGMSAWFFWNQK